METHKNVVDTIDKRTWLPAAIFGISLLATMFLFVTKEEPEKFDEVAVRPFVEVQTVQKGSHQMTVPSQGMVKPFMEAQLVAEVSGRVNELSVNFVAGAFVKKGDLLMVVERTDYLAELRIAEANLVRAKARLEQEKALSKQAEKDWQEVGNGNRNALASRKVQLNQQLADVRQAEAQLKRAKRHYQRTEIRAPYDGLILERTASVGQFVNTGTPVARIADTSLAEIRLPVTEKELSYVLSFAENSDKKPTVNLINTSAGEVREWQAYLERTEAVVNAQTRMVYLVARIPDPYGLKQNTSFTENPLRFGTFVTAAIAGKTVEGFAIPRNLINEQHETWVVNANDRLEKRVLSIYREQKNIAYVTSGLQSGDQLLMTKLTNPLIDMEVTFSKASPSGDGVAEAAAGEAN